MESSIIPRQGMLYFKKNLRQLIKYAVAGGIGAFTDFGLFTLLVGFFLINYLVANAVSFTLGTLVVYFLQKNWTFQLQSERNGCVFTKFIFIVIITYILNNLILVVCVEFLHIIPIIAKGIQIILSFIWGYTMNKKFVFK